MAFSSYYTYLITVSDFYMIHLNLITNSFHYNVTSPLPRPVSFLNLLLVKMTHLGQTVLLDQTRRRISDIWREGVSLSSKFVEERGERKVQQNK